MVDRQTILQIFGALMKHPQYLAEIDKYSLTPDDFSTRFDKFIFAGIDNLFRNGAVRITPIDIENYLQNTGTGKVLFEQNNGIEYLQDADYLSEEGNFPFYYNRLKKFNLLASLAKQGIDVSEFYVEDLTSARALEVNRNFDELTIEEILAKVKTKLLTVEKNFTTGEKVQTWELPDMIDEVIEGFGASESIGLSINGEILSTIINGAELGALTIRSAPSGGYKTAQAVSDACRLAYPFIYDDYSRKWIRKGNSQKVLFIMTEQKPEQVIQMVLAYLTGIERSRFKYGEFSDDEKKRIAVAREIMKHFNTLKLARIPDPNIELVKLTVREQVLLHDCQYVFFDYIFISPALLNEFRGNGLRNDELLLLMTTALKDLAIELNVSMFTSTQVNSRADDNTEIRNEASLAGGRATINKADNGMICARPTNAEKETLAKDGLLQGIEPNLVTDVFKVRSGRWTQIRIWSVFDGGTLRRRDLFATDSRMIAIPDLNGEDEQLVEWELTNEEEEFFNQLGKDING